MANGTDFQKPSWKQLGSLSGFIMECLTNILSFKQVSYWLGHKSELKKRLQEVFGINTAKQEHPKMKLVASRIEIPELVEEADFQKVFTENKKVKYWFGDNFKKHVLIPTKKVSNLPAMSFDKNKFVETIYDSEIMEHFQISKSAGLMTREEILRTIEFLISLQPKGEAGALQTNGYATIIGYMLCDDGVVRVVGVSWRSGASRWHCGCRDLGYWYADSEVLSRN